MPRPNRPYHSRNEPVGGQQERTHPLYSVWTNMLARCYVETNPAFDNYGARGINVCPRWWHFRLFAKDMGDRPAGLTLERKNNDKGYEPDNCVWATRTQQALNRRTFKTNVSEHTGIREIRGRFRTVIDYEQVRYTLGLFDTIAEAVIARSVALKRIKSGLLPEAAPETVWSTSSTGVRGVTCHKDGGYIVRRTVDGRREYVGYYKTFREAIDAKRG